jgi:hypothetical protein
VRMLTDWTHTEIIVLVDGVRRVLRPNGVLRSSLEKPA